MPDILIEDIMRILPHRYPMLLIDRVVECEGDRVVAIKNVTANEPCFSGHFPGRPIFPGVLQLEAMAQAGGVLMNQSYGEPGRIAYFLAVDKARFRRVIRPGDTMRIEVVFQRARLGMMRLHGTITVDGELACEADIMFGYGDA
ncbi:MAG: 3-hydroxyacyl-ACP dehydratase FabZ [Kiritimatiellae bacterium]|nr:3-hydroxyacyl-ACP dehydratase FabZ [Kiritimatiellia bacterium]MDW8458951.1 3-hydroxyacyl-ACP dehydratase FabZ [Verrucomicrobiota bacterium]